MFLLNVDVKLGAKHVCRNVKSNPYCEKRAFIPMNQTDSLRQAYIAVSSISNRISKLIGLDFASADSRQRASPVFVLD